MNESNWGAGGRARWMTGRYMLALTIVAGLVVSGYVFFNLVIHQHESMAALINISGRQRMLTQRGAFFVEKMIHASSDAAFDRSRLALLTVADQLEHAHDGLSLGDPKRNLPTDLSAAVRSMYFEKPLEIDRRVRQYVASLRSIAAAGNQSVSQSADPVRYVLTQGPGPLLESLDLVVRRQQSEGELALRQLLIIQTITVLTTLMLLVIEALVIFRPMVLRVDSQVRELEALGQRLRDANLTLEGRVRERTRDLDEARLLAEQANIGKSKFLAAASHDLQQPVEAISLFAGMLGREETSPRAKAIVRDLRAAQESMRSMLGQLIDLSRLEVGDVVPQIVTISLETLLEPLVAEFRTQAEGKGLRFRFVAVPARVKTDPVLFNRIVRNILSNAVRHTPEGGVLIGARRRNGMLRLEIHDTGPGIPEDMRERIFEEFYQLDEGSGDRSAGIGLGLPTARRFSQLLDHRLDMRSVVGRGTSFFLTVPIGSPDTDEMEP